MWCTRRVETAESPLGVAIHIWQLHYDLVLPAPQQSLPVAKIPGFNIGTATWLTREAYRRYDGDEVEKEYLEFCVKALTAQLHSLMTEALIQQDTIEPDINHFQIERNRDTVSITPRQKLPERADTTAWEVLRQQRSRHDVNGVCPASCIVRSNDCFDGIDVIIYQSKHKQITGACPVLIWAHGGGMALGRADSEDAPLSWIVAGSGSIIISVEYCLAPEHPFPSAVDQVEKIVKYVQSGLEDEYRNDQRYVLVGGVSSGASIAAVVAYRCALSGSPIAGTVLVAPVINHMADVNDTSRRACEVSKGLTTDAMCDYQNLYMFGSNATDAEKNLGSLTQSDLERLGLSSTLICVMLNDILCTEGVELAENYGKAGKSVRLERFDSSHEAFVCGGVDRVAGQIIKAIVDFIRNLQNV